MIANATEFYGNGQETDTTSLSEALFFDRETPIPLNTLTLVGFIERLGLPDLAADSALLVSTYIYRLGIDKGIKVMRFLYGIDIEDRLGISFRKAGLPNKPGINQLMGRIEPSDLLPDYEGLHLEMARAKFILEFPEDKALASVK